MKRIRAAPPPMHPSEPEKGEPKAPAPDRKASRCPRLLPGRKKKRYPFPPICSGRRTAPKEPNEAVPRLLRRRRETLHRRRAARPAVPWHDAILPERHAAPVHPPPKAPASHTEPWPDGIRRAGTPPRSALQASGRRAWRTASHHQAYTYNTPPSTPTAPSVPE